MATQHIDLDKVSLVETFPYLHRDGSGKFKQDLLSWLMEKIPEFAKLVHIQPIRVFAGETVQFSRNPRPILEGSKQVAFAFMEPRLPADGFKRMVLSNGEVVQFWSPVPIDRDELDASGRHGVLQFTRGLIRAGVTEMLHAQRPSAARAAYGLRRPFVKLARDCVRRVRARGKSL
jgi:hypothetical protein